MYDPNNPFNLPPLKVEKKVKVRNMFYKKYISYKILFIKLDNFIHKKKYIAVAEAAGAEAAGAEAAAITR